MTIGGFFVVVVVFQFLLLFFVVLFFNANFRDYRRKCKWHGTGFLDGSDD